MEKIKLNLGCGRDIKKDFINIDSIQNTGVNKIVDLNKFPWPFKDNSCDEILMNDILEHLDDPCMILKEIFRICKNKAIVNIRVPHFSSANTWADLTHKRAFSCDCFNYYLLNKKDSGSLENTKRMKFILKKRSLSFPKPYRWIGFNFLWSRCTKIYERCFYGIFPCGNIHFQLIVKKD